MPVTVFPSDHGANMIDEYQHTRFLNDSWAALHGIMPALTPESANILQSSFGPESLPPAMLSSTNGLVYSLISSYSNHRHLRIRPDDIWIAIITQLSIFILAHAEDLRHIFVAHKGQKPLAVTAGGDRYSVDFGHLAQKMTEKIERNILDPSWREWIIPDFSTSTRQDEVVASVLMMSTMQKYFTYEMRLICGIPSATLLGERADYERILHRLDKLATLGDEPTRFASHLRPVLRRFIRTFDDPKDQSVIDFWQRVMDVNKQMSGSTLYTGWITAFCFWNEEGEPLDGHLPYSEHEYSENGTFGDWVEKDAMGFKTHRRQDLRLSLDGVRYHTIESDKIPPAWGQVPVMIDDNGYEVSSVMVAGLVGLKYEESGDLYENGKSGLDTVQPQSGWWIYEKIEGDGGKDEL